MLRSNLKADAEKAVLLDYDVLIDANPTEKLKWVMNQLKYVNTDFQKTCLEGVNYKTCLEDVWKVLII